MAGLPSPPGAVIITGVTDDAGGIEDSAQRRRAEYRAFVREHHPDRGGDPEVFVAGLARFREGPVDDVPPADDPRWDAPIEFTRPLPLPTRVAVALIRTIRWHRQQRTLD